jgi:hypothetical protein
MTANNQDVGGLRGMGPPTSGAGSLSVHGNSDSWMSINGVTLQSANRDGGNSVSGTFLGAYSGNKWQEDNFSRRRRSNG